MYRIKQKEGEVNHNSASHLQTKKVLGISDSLPPQYVVFRYKAEGKYYSYVHFLSNDGDKVNLNEVEYYKVDPSQVINFQKSIHLIADKLKIVEIVDHPQLVYDEVVNQVKGEPIEKSTKGLIQNRWEYYSMNKRKVQVFGEKIGRSTPIIEVPAMKAFGVQHPNHSSKYNGFVTVSNVLDLSPQYVTNGSVIPGDLVEETNLDKLNEEIESVVMYAKTYNLQINLYGHTDRQGTPASNRVLSQARADGMKDYMISKFGKTYQLNDGDFKEPIGLGQTLADSDYNNAVKRLPLEKSKLSETQSELELKKEEIKKIEEDRKKDIEDPKYKALSPEEKYKNDQEFMKNIKAPAMRSLIELSTLNEESNKGVAETEQKVNSLVGANALYRKIEVKYTEK